jgi:glyoxylase-like metal-dependent hydrolase (beta-lactamase superfamily II)
MHVRGKLGWTSQPCYVRAPTVSRRRERPRLDRVVDSYTGTVTVGGPPDSRDTGPLVITKIAVGPMDNNAYFLRCASTGEVLLIDAANEPDRLLGVLGDDRLTRVVTTHQHFDHWQGLPEVYAATGAPVAAHPADAGGLPVTVAEPLEDGDTVRVGDCTLAVIHIVGHTPGSIALLYTGPDRPHLFTGDCLFPGGVGNTEKDPARFASLIDDVETKVFGRLPDETWVYPGHGKDTTLGAERPHLAEWRERGW